MSDLPIDRLIAEGWLFAAARVAFFGAIYLFLFVVLRATARDLHAAAQAMPSAEGAARAALLVLDPGQASLAVGEAMPLRAVTQIGRAAGNTLVVDDPHLSARHAELRFERGQWWLRDLGSRNGTTLNGESVRAVVGVRPGDVLQCGGVQCRLISSFPVPGPDHSA
jgi:pSer/pThr/pTyr-binding forkhead associated (FHA) protein